MTTDTRIARPLAAEAHLGLVVLLAAQVAAQVTRDETLLEDLVQAGCIGLLEALRRYDPAQGAFSTYAATWIKRHLWRTLQCEQQRPLAPPPAVPTADPLTTPLLDQRDLDTMQQGLPLLSLKERRVLELRFGLGDEPRHTLAETGLRLGISAGRARQIEQQALEWLRHTLEREPDGRCGGM
jgi:RNA polymerase sigma factor (sigma-70 family)